MESYVVRVYRRQRGASRQLVGEVDAPQLNGTAKFASVEELWEILSGKTLFDQGQGRAGGADKHVHRDG